MRRSPLKRVPASFSRTKGAARGGHAGRTATVNVLVMTFAAGMVTTMALPAYATTPQPGSASLGSDTSQQHLAVSAGVEPASVAHDSLSATSVAALNARQAHAESADAAATAARARRVATQSRSVTGATTYSGPSTADFLKNPPYPDFSLAKVFQVAEQYIGTPYVFGGDTPAGFDCSGLVMYVYAQFGISLPHSATAQGAMGTRISINDAVPGDLIVMPGHIGFYAGGNKILDAPDSGKSVSIRPIWTSNYYVVRLGIK
jgi:cell wall-associated NlpC family hydrolase